jgi:hypothetical protein
MATRKNDGKTIATPPPSGIVQVVRRQVVGDVELGSGDKPALNALMEVVANALGDDFGEPDSLEFNLDGTLVKITTEIEQEQPSGLWSDDRMAAYLNQRGWTVRMDDVPEAY